MAGVTPSLDDGTLRVSCSRGVLWFSVTRTR